MNWLEKPSQKKVIINKADETVKPIVTLQGEHPNSEIIIAKEEGVYSAYIKNEVGFFYYQPLAYWYKEMIMALHKYFQKD